MKALDKAYRISLAIFFFILGLMLLLSSCSTVKRYTYEAVNLQPGEISKYHVRCELIEEKETARGRKHVFVSDKGDTLTRYTAPRKDIYDVGQCYFVWKTKLDK